MFIITVEGDNYPKYTEKVEWKDGRIVFECTTKKGKVQKHNIQEKYVIDIVETERREPEAGLPLGESGEPF